MITHAHEFYTALFDTLIANASPAHDSMVDELVNLRERKGRLFCIGVGGGAANAAHAVNDFRKLCGIEAYAPTDCVSELTARANDEGWHTVFVGWLKVSQFSCADAIMVFSVGGGTPSVSACIHSAVFYAKSIGARILGVVGRPEGITATHGDVVVLVRSADPKLLTPVVEAAQVAVLHALVSDPRLQSKKTKW